MFDEENTDRRIEQYKYRAMIAEAENVAVKSSKAYKLIKLFGSMKADFKKNPVGLTRKAARILLTQPSKILSKGRNREIVTQSIIEQTNKYQEWILLNEPQDNELREQYRESEKFKYKPLISIVTPVFNPPVDVLEELIESVLCQTYPHFELCLGDFGNSSGVGELLEKYARLDDRIKYWRFSENNGISANSNVILDKVQGEYIGLLDHDDTLSPDALYENVKALNSKKYDFIYSDKDKIDEKNNRFDPLFKPQFSPEMLLNINYLTHFNVMRTELVKRVGAWDSSTDGAQDWDLFLKVIAKSESIYHIPIVLYHWRVIASSTALSIETKPYALAGQRKAVDKYLDEVGIPAKSFHTKTELILDWDEDKISTNPIVVITQSSQTRTRYIIRKFKLSAPGSEFIIVGDQVPGNTVKDKTVLGYIHSDDYCFDSLDKLAKLNRVDYSKRTMVFVDDSLDLARDWYKRLVGWLGVPGVAVVSGRVVNKYDTIIDAGGVVSNGQYQPLFCGFPKYYQGYLGNAEWVRNLSMVSGVYFAVHGGAVAEYVRASGTDTKSDIHGLFEWVVSVGRRIAMSPQAIAITTDTKHILSRLSAVKVNKISAEDTDRYSNPNVSINNPMVLFDEEENVNHDSRTSELDAYQRDAIILANSYDITQSEINANIKAASNKYSAAPKTAAFVLPSFEAVYAGLMNIFSFAEYLQTNHDVAVSFYILKNSAHAKAERELVIEKIPELKKARYVAITEQQTDKIEAHDMGIATLWSTAFVLAKSTNVNKKYYFIQDNEANFYPKGTLSALVEMSYRFGFYAIANTDGLLDMYKSKYNGEGTVLQSKVDLSSYKPKTNPYLKPVKPYKVFFYARPNMPRNAFELGIAGLKRLKIDLGDDVEIITAGAPWNPKDFGVENLFTNLGKIRYEAVPKLYRSVDAGLMFMFSGHPGVTASELMASGCPVVVNEYDDITWNELYQHEKTCLITKATASEVADSLKRCLVDEQLREKLIKNGLQKAKTFYGGYGEQLNRAYADILSYYRGQ